MAVTVLVFITLPDLFFFFFFLKQSCSVFSSQKLIRLAVLLLDTDNDISGIFLTGSAESGTVVLLRGHRWEL